MSGHPAQNEQVGENVNHVGSLELRATRMAKHSRVNSSDVEHPDLPPVMGARLDEVVGPDMVGTLRLEPDARSVVEPQTASLRLPGRNFQPLPSPDPLDPFQVDGSKYLPRSR